MLKVHLKIKEKVYKRKLKGNNNSVPEKYSPIANEDKFFIKLKTPSPFRPQYSGLLFMLKLMKSYNDLNNLY